MKKRIDIAALAPVVGTLYPSPFDEPCRARARTKLGDVAGLTQFGVNLLRLPPGAWSSQRHWHTGSDEFVYVLSGEVVLVTDGGEEILRHRRRCRVQSGRDRDPRGRRYGLLFGYRHGRAGRRQTRRLYAPRRHTLPGHQAPRTRIDELSSSLLFPFRGRYGNYSQFNGNNRALLAAPLSCGRVYWIVLSLRPAARSAKRSYPAAMSNMIRLASGSFMNSAMVRISSARDSQCSGSSRRVSTAHLPR